MGTLIHLPRVTKIIGFICTKHGLNELSRKRAMGDLGD